MRKFATGITLSTVVLGATGFFLRDIELKTIFDSTTGLAEANPITFILAALSVATAIVILMLVLKLRDFVGFSAYEKAFKVKSPILMILSLLLAVVMIYASYLYYAHAKTLDSKIAESILALLAALSGLSYLTLSINSWRRKGGTEMPLSCFIIVIFICYWLILTYKQNAADPVILDYVYDTLALCSAALATYYITGFCYNRGSPVKTLFFSNFSIYFCLVALAGTRILPIILFYIFTASMLLINSVTLILNLKTPEEDITDPNVDDDSDTGDFDISDLTDIVELLNNDEDAETPNDGDEQ